MYGEADARTVDAWRTVAMIKLKMRNYERAGGLLAKVLDREVALYGSDSVKVADTNKLLGTVYLAKQQLEETLSAFQRCLKIYKYQLGDEHPKTVSMVQLIASVKEHVVDTDHILMRRATRRGNTSHSLDQSFPSPSQSLNLSAAMALLNSPLSTSDL